MSSFLYKSFFHSFYVLKIWVCNIWQKDFGTKAAHEMLVKLTPGHTQKYYIMLIRLERDKNTCIFACRINDKEGKVLEVANANVVKNCNQKFSQQLS
jgi:hypothetical protein